MLIGNTYSYVKFSITCSFLSSLQEFVFCATQTSFLYSILYSLVDFHVICFEIATVDGVLVLILVHGYRYIYLIIISLDHTVFNTRISSIYMFCDFMNLKHSVLPIDFHVVCLDLSIHWVTDSNMVLILVHLVEHLPLIHSKLNITEFLALGHKYHLQQKIHKVSKKSWCRKDHEFGGNVLKWGKL